MAMALSGAEESYADYLQALKAYVENAYAKNCGRCRYPCGRPNL